MATCAAATKAVLAPVSREAERRKLHETQSAWTLTSGSFGVDPRAGLVDAIGLDLRDGTGQVTAGQADNRPTKKDAQQPTTYVSDTGQLRWDLSQPGAGCFIADTPRTKLFSGFIHGRQFQLGDVSLKPGPTRFDWATVSMVAIEGGRLGQGPGRVLIAATGAVQEHGAELEDLGNNRVTLRNNWGTAPILCEGIPATILLPVAPDRVRLYPLDAAGNRREAVPVSAENGRAKLDLTPRHRTLWYEVEIR